MTLKDQIKFKKLLKRDICKHLDITMPTLKSKLDDPKRLTILDVEKLRELELEITV
jgi:hypothetical protein